MVRTLQVALACLAVAAVAPAVAQRGPALPGAPTLPGSWPLTGGAAAQPAPGPSALPDRRIDIPDATRPQLAPGVDVSAGYMFEGQDPTVRPDGDGRRPRDRYIPREANDQPRAVPGVTVTVPIGP